jgi:hypothetical protein
MAFGSRRVVNPRVVAAAAASKHGVVHVNNTSNNIFLVGEHACVLWLSLVVQHAGRSVHLMLV